VGEVLAIPPFVARNLLNPLAFLWWHRHCWGSPALFGIRAPDTEVSQDEPD
jgi:hypothetical protein